VKIGEVTVVRYWSSQWISIYPHASYFFDGFGWNSA